MQLFLSKARRRASEWMSVRTVSPNLMALRNGELQYSYGDDALSSEPLALSPKAGVTLQREGCDIRRKVTQLGELAGGQWVAAHSVGSWFHGRFDFPTHHHGNTAPCRKASPLWDWPWLSWIFKPGKGAKVGTQRWSQLWPQWHGSGWPTWTPGPA